MSPTSNLLMFVVPTYEGGGAERVVFQIAGALHHKGRSVLVVGLYEPASSNANSEVPIIGLALRRVSSSIRPLRELVRRYRPAVVVSTLKHVTIAVAFVHAAERRAFRHVARIANTYSAELEKLPSHRRIIWRMLLSLCHRSTYRNICVSEGVRRDLVGRFAVSNKRCVTVFNPIDIAGLYRRAEETSSVLSSLQQTRKLVLAVGRLTPQKDFRSLIQAFKYCQRPEAPDSELLILGDGPERESLLALIDRLGLAGRVHLPGWVRNPYPAYRAASVFALSSRFEGFPNVLLEALAFGLPVVSTDCKSGPGEILTYEGLGELVPAENPAALAEALLRGLQKPKSPDRREHVQIHYSLERISRAYEHALES